MPPYRYPALSFSRSRSCGAVGPIAGAVQQLRPQWRSPRGSLIASLIAVLVVTAQGAAATTAATPPALGFHVHPKMEEILRVTGAGFDFVEIAAGPLATMTPEAFEQFRQEVSRLPVPVLTANMDLPGRIKQVGPDVDPAQQRAILRSVIERAAQLGIKTVLLGGSGARKVPDSFSREKAMLQYLAFVRLAMEEADRRQMTVAIEPHRRDVTNFINTVSEAIAVVDAVAHPRFKLSLDLYHLWLEKVNPAQAIDQAGPRLGHLQFSNPNGRVAPLSREEFDYLALFEALRRIRYQGGVSLELGGTGRAAERNHEQMAPSLAFLRGLVREIYARPLPGR